MTSQVGPSDRSRTDEPGNSSQSNRSHSASRAHPTPSSRSRRALRASREEEAHFSTPAVQDSLWFASDFLLSAGMVVIQPSSGKVVILSEEEQDEDGRVHHYWFLPKGRKNAGESLERTALREASEESGFRVTFLPIILRHNAPGAPGSLARLDRARMLPCIEPIYISTRVYKKGGRTERDGEYLTVWFIGQIPHNEVVEPGTRMSNGVNYGTHLLSIEEALFVLPSAERYIVRIAYHVWQETVELQSQSIYKEYVAQLRAKADASNASASSAPVPTSAMEGTDQRGESGVGVEVTSELGLALF